jgi:hypothetical protein
MVFASSKLRWRLSYKPYLFRHIALTRLADNFKACRRKPHVKDIHGSLRFKSTLSEQTSFTVDEEICLAEFVKSRVARRILDTLLFLSEHFVAYQ